jgi:hypothetical protein
MTTPRVLARLRKLCLALPDACEKISHGEPGFFVKKKRMFAMFANAANHHGRGRHAVWIKAAPGRQARAVGTDPARFLVPPYAGPSGWVGVYLEWVSTSMTPRGGTNSPIFCGTRTRLPVRPRRASVNDFHADGSRGFSRV